MESLRNSHIPEDYLIYDDGYYYKAFDTKKTWDDAQATCQTEGAHLPVCQNERMCNFVLSLKPAGTWVGLTDQAKEGTWLTWDGKEAPYVPWAVGEPNNIIYSKEDNIYSKEDCAYLKKTKEMNDVRCNRSTTDFVCQIKGK